MFLRKTLKGIIEIKRGITFYKNAKRKVLLIIN